MVRRHGDPDVLEHAEVPVPEPAAGQVRVALRMIGVNRRDSFIRAGIYKRDLPLVPGIEGAGIVDAIGPGVTGWSIGDRVIYTSRICLAPMRSIMWFRSIGWSNCPSACPMQRQPRFSIMA